MKPPPFTPGTAPPPCRKGARPVARPTHFSGWLRTGRAGWRLVCRKPTEAEVWAYLLPLRVEGEASVEKVVRPGDRHPEHRRKPR